MKLGERIQHPAAGPLHGVMLLNVGLGGDGEVSPERCVLDQPPNSGDPLVGPVADAHQR